MTSRHDGSLQNTRNFSLTLLSYLEQPLAQVRIYRQAIATNSYLHRQNILLQDELSRLRSVRQQNEILRSLLNLREVSTHSLIPVSVVAKELRSLNTFITVDAGTLHGARVGMPVINSDGLVGTVILVNERFSQVLPYNNSLFRVSAQIENSRASGIVSGEPDSGRILLLQFIPETIPVTPGEMVLTSGFSNQFPAGIPIGEVLRVETNTGQNTLQVYIQAFTDLNTLSEAFLVDFEPDSSINSLINQQRSLF
ncbi:MAG: rod shape-determining protein MreC [Balneolaceae bacterium]|nr:MAG: rod shape-determining protein MreC [Balneolaceae bacterium]